MCEPIARFAVFSCLFLRLCEGIMRLRSIIMSVALCTAHSAVLAQSSGAAKERGVSLPAGEGSIQGLGESFDADLASGAARYGVSFALPQGRAGVTPQLGLSYSSGQGSSVVGIGWSLAVPAIARRTDGGVPRYRDRAQWHAEEDR